LHLPLAARYKTRKEKTMSLRRRLVSVVLMLCLATVALAHAQTATDDPPVAQTPALIKVSDREAIEANMGRNVIAEGTVSTAEWSRTGRVMNIDFSDAVDPKLMVVLFDRSRKRFDEAFGGDLSKAITGQTVRIKGKLEPYGGQVEVFKDRPQIILNHTSQITILEEPPQ
jgi:DNA/RNA endonuclease YhcR with UshA esterase domain